jgi:hypothetical protein
MAKPALEPEEAPEENPVKIILGALHAVMEEVAYVQKSGENDFHDYTYATEADVLKRLRPAMLKHGLMLIPNVQQVSGPDPAGNTTVTVQYTLCHISGAIWPGILHAAGCGGDKHKNGVGDKGLYKALTGANKYFLFKLFQIETGDGDPEDASGDRNRADPPDKGAREFYREGALIAISKADNVEDLKKWWNDEAENRAHAGVIKLTEEYEDIYAAFLRRGNKLKKGER